MATCPEITKKYARQYVKAGKAEKWRLQDALVATTGWARDNSRRAIRLAAARKGAAREQQH